MPSEYIIEVCAEPEDSSTDRGRLLEAFATRFLNSQGFQVQTEVRVTGVEVDLLCSEQTTGESVMVECKAYRSTISAEVLTKLYGTVMMKDYGAGWLITTHALGKDAKGLEAEWREKAPEIRRKLVVLPPEKLVPRLIAANTVVDPDQIPLGPELKRTGEAYLLLSKRGNFWALPIIDNETGVAGSVSLHDATNGTAITGATLLAWILQTDTTLKTLSPVTILTGGQRAKLKAELDNIVSVPMADHWADYRPSRPADFVGRESVQKDIFSLLNQVRSGTTSTRLLALKAPSGWGKSSAVLKVVDKAKGRMNRAKFYIHAVDSRGASTERFPELALVSSLKAAAAAGFLHHDQPINIGSLASVFGTPSMEAVTRYLADSGKVLCIFFDQFEELLYKEELSHVFDQMRQLCAAVEEAQVNIVVGFSWKTDGTITTEHGAYHLWHNLSDRRHEIDLPPFNDREVSLAIGKFGRELGQPVAPQLRRLLEDNCQGFPWLLKKLCVNILDAVRNGSDQSDVLASGLNIGALFQKDISQLTAKELSCLKQIGRDSPAEYFRVVESFGDEVVTSLINKRLVIRSGVRLSLYWDIFREFVLTESIPYIPVTYIPQANFSRYIGALKFLLGKSQVSYDDLSSAMSLNSASTDNLVRDLVNLGHAEASRKDAVLRPLFLSSEEAAEIAYKFWRSHDIVRKIDAEFGDAPLSMGEFEEIFIRTHARKQYAPQTLNIYARRTVRWLLTVGLFDQITNDFYSLDTLGRIPDNFLDAKFVRERGNFLGEAPPEAVCAALEALRASDIPRLNLEKLVGRNAVTALLGLKLATIDSGNVATAQIDHALDSESLVRRACKEQWTINAAIEEVDKNENVRGDQVGARIASEIGKNWSDGSLTRYGSALKRWAIWAES